MKTSRNANKDYKIDIFESKYCENSTVTVATMVSNRYVFVILVNNAVS